MCFPRISRSMSKVSVDFIGFQGVPKDFSGISKDFQKISKFSRDSKTFQRISKY